ncbi:MAG: SagB/ThcOx family dehydrogenase [Lentisphaerae bacterium]|nr:SagB/ThcOx family dehydrogenase [Lentisphaerota bacterium]
MGDWRLDTDQTKGRPAPLAHKPPPLDAHLIALPRPDTLHLGAMPLKDAIGQRRSRRAFSDAPLTLSELSFLLWCTQGITKIERDKEGQIVNEFRTVPSGGARHPFETYLLLNRVTSLIPGLYRYLPLDHALVLLRADDALEAKSVEACYDAAFVGQAAVVFVWAALPARTEWRYGPIAHRMIAIEAGHVAQNLALAVESLGAGCCPMLGYNQRKMDALIGVDGDEEFTIYLAPVGKVRHDTP